MKWEFGIVEMVRYNDIWKSSRSLVEDLHGPYMNAIAFVLNLLNPHLLPAPCPKSLYGLEMCDESGFTGQDVSPPMPVYPVVQVDDAD